MQQNHPPAQPTWYKNISQVDESCQKVIPNYKPQNQPNQPIEDDEPEELLEIVDANDCLKTASTKPIPRMLFGKFWFEGEICILFADSNLGKSILAVQIGNSIGSGKAVTPFEFEAQKQPILYCDFELTDKQFEARYSNNYADHFTFTGFMRAGLNPNADLPPGFDDFDDYLLAALERAIVKKHIKVIIIDNLTYLRNETEQAKDALPLMKELKALKNKYGLSILILAHTPKRDLTQQITLNDLQGSKMLMNFCDSAFTIGESSAAKGLRYLKQIKQRNTNQEYGYSNVCLFKIDKPHNFLQYEFAGYGNELDHLRKAKDKFNDAEIEEAAKYRLEGLSLRQIAKKMGINYQRVDRLLKAGGGED